MASTIVRTTSEAPRSPSGGSHDAGGSSGAAEPLSDQSTNSLLHARLGQFTPVSRQTHGHADGRAVVQFFSMPMGADRQTDRETHGLSRGRP